MLGLIFLLFVASTAVARCEETSTPLVLVVCQGGPRTSSLMHIISDAVRRAGMQTNDLYDSDGLKHRWFAAEMEVLERARMSERVTAAVYLYDDPENIVAELIQRKWLYSVAQRTRSLVALVASPAYNVLRNEQATIDEAAAAMTDLLELEPHFDSWVAGARTAGFPILFLRSATAWQYLANISSFLNVPLNYFPPPDAVRGDIGGAGPEIPKEALDRLQATYLQLRIKYEQEGDAFILRHDTPPRPAVLVVSVGGEGTTSFIDMLTRAKIPCNHIWDDDGLKHRWFGAEMALVQRLQQRGHRFAIKAVIYLWDDPAHAVASLIRRGWLWDQAEKTRLTMPQKQTDAYRVLTSEEVTAEQIAATRSDVLEIEGHFTSWMRGAATADFPTLFLRSSTRWKHIDALASFLHVPPNVFPEDSRQEHTRKSTRPLAPEIAAMVEETFGNLTTMQKSLGEFYVVPRRGTLSSLFSSSLSDPLVHPTHPALSAAGFQVTVAGSAHSDTYEVLYPLLVVSTVALLALSLALVAWILRHRRRPSI
eukprot:m.10345 g.10345  ORF g.10345 m.10345 type:complete len:537 (+) comp5589_c1_seq1:182-1792(+)